MDNANRTAVAPHGVVSSSTTCVWSHDHEFPLLRYFLSQELEGDRRLAAMGLVAAIPKVVAWMQLVQEKAEGRVSRDEARIDLSVEMFLCKFCPSSSPNHNRTARSRDLKNGDGTTVRCECDDGALQLFTEFASVWNQAICRWGILERHECQRLPKFEMCLTTPLIYSCYGEEDENVYLKLLITALADIQNDFLLSYLKNGIAATTNTSEGTVNSPIAKQHSTDAVFCTRHGQHNGIIPVARTVVTATAASLAAPVPLTDVPRLTSNQLLSTSWFAESVLHKTGFFCCGFACEWERTQSQASKLQLHSHRDSQPGVRSSGRSLCVAWELLENYIREHAIDGKVFLDTPKLAQRRNEIRSQVPALLGTTGSSSQAGRGKMAETGFAPFTYRGEILGNRTVLTDLIEKCGVSQKIPLSSTREVLDEHLVTCRQRSENLDFGDASAPGKTSGSGATKKNLDIWAVQEIQLGVRRTAVVMDVADAGEAKPSTSNRDEDAAVLVAGKEVSCSTAVYLRELPLAERLQVLCRLKYSDFDHVSSAERDANRRAMETLQPDLSLAEFGFAVEFSSHGNEDSDSASRATFEQEAISHLQRFCIVLRRRYGRFFPRELESASLKELWDRLKGDVVLAISEGPTELYGEEDYNDNANDNHPFSNRRSRTEHEKERFVAVANNLGASAEERPAAQQESTLSPGTEVVDAPVSQLPSTTNSASASASVVWLENQMKGLVVADLFRLHTSLELRASVRVLDAAEEMVGAGSTQDPEPDAGSTDAKHHEGQGSLRAQSGTAFLQASPGAAAASRQKTHVRDRMQERVEAIFSRMFPRLMSRARATEKQSFSPFDSGTLPPALPQQEQKKDNLILPPVLLAMMLRRIAVRVQLDFRLRQELCGRSRGRRGMVDEILSATIGTHLEPFLRELYLSRVELCPQLAQLELRFIPALVECLDKLDGFSHLPRPT
ncbi:unnamed protein product [Amoebophrya sp. A120]|nr:unnamed protein product [Amoebophrya sp. A120]|eukprot:GSA120T00024416001.1